MKLARVSSVKLGILSLLLVVQGMAIIPVSASQDWPPTTICQAMRDYNPAMCLLTNDLNYPLADRIPIILIHGWNKNEIPGKPDITVWSGLIKYLEQNRWFKEKYKLYYLAYLSNVQSIRDMGLIFTDLISQMDEADPFFEGKPLVVISYSMGGLVARSFMEEPRSRNALGLGGDRVLRLITLGTPHHGTPIANGPARDHKAGRLVSYLFDIIDHGLFNGSLTWSTDNRFDLHWDNYDNLLDYDKYPEDNSWLKWLNSGNTFENKISAYGGTVEPLTQVDDCVFSDFKDPGCLAGIMKNNLGIPQSDGVVPLNSALFDPCTECISRQSFPGYDHFEIVSGKSDNDSHLFGAVAGDLAELVAPGDRRFDNIAYLGDSEDESFHSLRGWGMVNPIFNQSRGNGRGTSRFQTIGGRSSLDLFIDKPLEYQILGIETQDGVCDDSFDVYVGDRLIWSHKHKSPEPLHTVSIYLTGDYFPHRRVTVSFVNTAKDDCGYAPVYYVSLLHYQ